MSKVDWSLAPNWATHALVKLHNPGIFGVHWSYFIDGEHRIGPDGLWFHPDGYRVAEKRPRNLKPKPWSGPEDGIPAVGSIVLARRSDTNKWHESEVLRHSTECQRSCVCAFMEVKSNMMFWSSEYKAIKTQDQIAYDKRETAIREIMDIADVDCRVTAARLVDAGFKREVV